LLMI